MNTKFDGTMSSAIDLREAQLKSVDDSARAPMHGAHLSIECIDHSYGALRVLSEIEFDVKPGEIVALLGPSGCGKSTILRIIAGFIRQTNGRILVDGAVIDKIPPNRRQLGFVFQNYALFPHLTLRQNIGYGLVARGMKRQEVRERVDEILQLIQLSDYADRLPRDLSGGQQQRVATGRSLAVQPRLLLLDEPFGALDKNLRLDMQIEFLRIQRKIGISSIIVTHDQEEAFSLANRVIVLNGGRVEQIGTPAEIYDRPDTLFVNGFVGSTNELKGEIVKAGEDSTAVRLLDSEVFTVRGGVSAAEGAQVVLTARPEHMNVSDAKLTGSLPGVVDAVLPVGPSLIYEIVLEDGTPVKVNQPRFNGCSELPRGAEVFVVLPEEQCQIFVDGRRVLNT